MTHEGWSVDFIHAPQSMKFRQDGREVMCITPEGELIVHDASAAADVLMKAWKEAIHVPHR